MFQTNVSTSPSTTPYVHSFDERLRSLTEYLPDATAERETKVVNAVLRRWRRERRRRKVGRAYDMALELARLVPRRSRVLDVGCGNGYISHHLSALLRSDVLGIDLESTTEAPINYRQFDGTRFPANDQSFDCVLLCYVLHHAQQLNALLSELRRVLTKGGLVVVYEDMPQRWWDRLVCGIHNRKWRGRTGPCTFRVEAEWRSVFEVAGFEIVKERELSRWRNLAHPVARRLYVLKTS